MQSVLPSLRVLHYYHCFLQFHLQLPAALHEMLGSFDSHPSASEPAESPPLVESPLKDSCGRSDRSFSGGLMQLQDLLFESAQAVTQNDWDRAQRIIELLSEQISATGESAERVAACFSEALATRISRATGRQIKLFPALPDQLSSEEIISAYLALNQVTPYIRFAHLTANQALLEALNGEEFLHIVDLDIGHGVQWPPFMQALADLRSEGEALPHLRITGVGIERDTLDRTGSRLENFAQSVQLPFEFVPLVQELESLDSSMLGLRIGEAFAVNCMLRLHGLLGKGMEAVSDFLSMLFSLTPKVVTLAEREADHNQPFLLDRFGEALQHYSTLFDSLEATLPPTSSERVKVEHAWLCNEIVNIVACEGFERVVRHQRFDQWRRFMERVGFQLLPTSTFALSQARLLLRLHYPSEGYRLVEEEGCLFLGWQDQPLFAVSSWHPV